MVKEKAFVATHDVAGPAAAAVGGYLDAPSSKCLVGVELHAALTDLNTSQ